jgi:hypothetical protein
MITDRILLTVSLLLATSTAAGCGGDSKACTSPQDCFRAEVCYLGECIDEDEVPVSVNATPNSTTNSNPNGNPNGNPNATSNSNANGSTNAVPNNETFCGFDNCVVDPFICGCADDGNDSFADLIQTSNVGCVAGGFEPMEKTFRARICALEERDRFRQQFIECDTQTFRLRVTMTPAVEVCDTSNMLMNLSVQGKSCAEQAASSDITCSWNAQGQFVAQALIRPGRSVNAFTIDVSAGDRNDIDFVYDLTVEVTE